MRSFSILLTAFPLFLSLGCGKTKSSTEPSTHSTAVKRPPKPDNSHRIAMLIGSWIGKPGATPPGMMLTFKPGGRFQCQVKETANEVIPGSYEVISEQHLKIFLHSPFGPPSLFVDCQYGVDDMSLIFAFENGETWLFSKLGA